MNLIGTRQIETDRCILRRIRPEDCEAMYENWARYEEVCRYFPFHPVSGLAEITDRDNNETGTFFFGTRRQCFMQTGKRRITGSDGKAVLTEVGGRVDLV